jgi:hypothetical protein
MPTLREGHLYREASLLEVYVVHDGRKIWIPTPDALRGMGYDWGSVTIVPDGALDGLARFAVPSGSPTPCSLVVEPGALHHPNTDVPGTVRVISRGHEIRLIELFGWLRAVDANCGDGSDFHYLLEVDSEWALDQGIDLNRLLRVGNIRAGIPLSGFRPRRAVALPLILVELDSDRRLPRGASVPADWTFQGNCELTWPFDHYQPILGGPRLRPMRLDLNTRGPYVKISGALITDHPHHEEGQVATFFSRWLGISVSDDAEYRGSVSDWHPGVAADDPRHFARWTEIHPPDRIEVLPAKKPQVTLRAIALAARVAATPGPLIPSCEEVTVDLAPDMPRPPNSSVGWQELRGPETHFPWGENADNGSWITDLGDRIRVKAKVCGGALGGSPGRFKALYRLWWREGRGGWAANDEGILRTSDSADLLYYRFEHSAIGSDAVEYVLHNDTRSGWRKELRIPNGLLVADGRGSSDRNGNWIFELPGQQIIFRKAKEFGRMYDVLTLGQLDQMLPGDRVHFHWQQD